MTQEIIESEFLFLYSVIFGFLTGILFEFFRLIRIFFKPKTAFVFISDIIFSVLLSFSVLFFNFLFADGEIRYYVMLGIIIGMICYFLTLGKYIVKAAEKIKKALIMCYRKTLLPICEFFVKIIKMLFTKITNVVIILIKRKKQKKDRLLKKKLKNTFEKGFGAGE